jgi:modulator of FtsH protease HflK
MISSPDRYELIEDAKDAVRGLVIGLTVVGTVLAVWVACTGFFSVAADEVGVIERLGKFNRISAPGWHFKYPRGIESVKKIKVSTVITEEFGTMGSAAGGAIRSRDLLLTADLNCVLVSWKALVRISDAREFLYQNRDTRSAFRDLAEAVMSGMAGSRTLEEMISLPPEFSGQYKARLQDALRDAGLAITIVEVEISRVGLPPAAAVLTQGLDSALRDKEKLVRAAREEYHLALPAALGQAERIVKEAEAYSVDKINRSRGDAARFLALYEVYAKSKDLTRKRLYFETMAEVLPKVHTKYIVDPEWKGNIPK